MSTSTRDTGRYLMYSGHGWLGGVAVLHSAASVAFLAFEVVRGTVTFADPLVWFYIVLMSAVAGALVYAWRSKVVISDEGIRLTAPGRRVEVRWKDVTDFRQRGRGRLRIFAGRSRIRVDERFPQAAADLAAQYLEAEMRRRGAATQ